MYDKKHGIPSYSPLEGDDIRTIPDFYDNLYPTCEQPQSSIIPAKTKTSNKPKTVRNNQKNKEK